MEYIEYELLAITDRKNLFDEIIQTCILDIENEIREAIKKRWLRSESVNGGSITNKITGNASYARLSYKNIKLAKNPSAGGGVDLTFSGSLGDKIEIIKHESGNYEIVSTDSKFMKICEMYGADEFGLSENEMAYFMKKLEDKINIKL